MVTDGLGLVTLAIAGLNVMALTDPALTAPLSRGAPLLVVLGSVVVGGVIGALLRLETRLEGLGATLQRRLSRGETGGEAQRRFVEGYVTASLVFCVGPLTVLGSLQDGMGDGIELLTLKAVLDGFAALAFAASLGWGVTVSALTVLVVQGGLTLLGVLAGEVMSDAATAAMTATGGVLLLGVGICAAPSPGRSRRRPASGPRHRPRRNRPASRCEPFSIRDPNSWPPGTGPAMLRHDRQDVVSGVDPAVAHSDEGD